MKKFSYEKYLTKGIIIECGLCIKSKKDEYRRVSFNPIDVDVTLTGDHKGIQLWTELVFFLAYFNIYRVKHE